MSSFEQRSPAFRSQRAHFTMGAQRTTSRQRSLLLTRDASLQLAASLVRRRVSSHRAHHGVPIFSSESRGTGWLSAAAACEVMSTWAHFFFHGSVVERHAVLPESAVVSRHQRPFMHAHVPSLVDLFAAVGGACARASFSTCWRASDEPFSQTVGEFDGLWWEGRWHGQRAPFAAPALVHSLGGDCLAGFCWERVLGEVLKFWWQKPVTKC